MQTRSLSPITRRTVTALAAFGAAFALVTTGAAASRISVRVHFPNHHPVMNRPWVITWTATRGHRRLSGSDRYAFYIGNRASGSPVRTAKGVRFSHGHGRDTLKFPPAAVGHQLTLKVIVATRSGTVGIPWVLTTRR